MAYQGVEKTDGAFAFASRRRVEYRWDGVSMTSSSRGIYLSRPTHISSSYSLLGATRGTPTITTMTTDTEKNVVANHVDAVHDDVALAEIAQHFKEVEERRPLREVFHAYKAAMFWSILVSMVSRTLPSELSVLCMLCVLSA